MVRYAVEERRLNPMIRYDELVKRTKRRFATSKHTAERAIAEANAVLKDEFQRSNEEAAIQIDAFFDMVAQENWAKSMTEKGRDAAALSQAAVNAMKARAELRGLTKGNVLNVFVGTGLPPEAFKDLTDAQLDALAALDEGLDAGDVIDAESSDAAGATDADEDLDEDDEEDEASP